MGTAMILLRFAEAYARLGQPVDGLNYLAEAAQIIQATDERVDEPPRSEAHRTK